MQKIVFRRSANKDLVEYYVYLYQQAGEELAERFLASAEKSFNQIALNPLIGSAVELKNKKLMGIRKWRVESFENTLIFYIPDKGSISVVRVLYTAQDWWKLIGV